MTFSHLNLTTVYVLRYTDSYFINLSKTYLYNKVEESISCVPTRISRTTGQIRKNIFAFEPPIIMKG